MEKSQKKNVYNLLSANRAKLGLPNADIRDSNILWLLEGILFHLFH